VGACSCVWLECNVSNPWMGLAVYVVGMGVLNVWLGYVCCVQVHGSWTGMHVGWCLGFAIACGCGPCP